MKINDDETHDILIDINIQLFTRNYVMQAAEPLIQKSMRPVCHKFPLFFKKTSQTAIKIGHFFIKINATIYFHALTSYQRQRVPNSKLSKLKASLPSAIFLFNFTKNLLHGGETKRCEQKQHQKR